MAAMACGAWIPPTMCLGKDPTATQESFLLDAALSQQKFGDPPQKASWRCGILEKGTC